MRTLTPIAVLLALLLAAAPAARATDVGSYSVRLVTSADGSATGSAAIGLEAAEPGPISIPLPVKGANDVVLAQAPAGTTVAASPANGQTQLRLVLPEGVPASVAVRVTFAVGEAFQKTTPAPGERPTLPAGALLFRHSLVNTLPGPIGKYRVEVLFPEGMRAHALREALPKLRKGEAGPRARLAEIDGRHGAWLVVDRLAQAETAVLQVELVPQRVSPVWLIAGALLAIAYLVTFRDLVRRPPA